MGLQDLGDSSMEVNSSGKADRLVQPLTEGDVGETHTTLCARYVGNDSSGEWFLQYHDELLDTALGQLTEGIDVELASHYRGQREDVQGVGRQMLQPTPNDLSHALRQADATTCIAGRRLEPTLLQQQSNDLLNE